MHSKLFASLEEAIDKWVESICESDEWEITFDVSFFPPSGVNRMAKASAAVFDGMVDAGRYSIEQGCD
jgi:hypothetical protein